MEYKINFSIPSGMTRSFDFKLNQLVLLFLIMLTVVSCTTTTEIQEPISRAPLKPEIPICKKLYTKTETTLKHLGFTDTISDTHSNNDTLNRIISGLIFWPLALFPNGATSGDRSGWTSKRRTELNDELWRLKNESKTHQCNLDTFIAMYYEEREKKKKIDEESNALFHDSNFY